MSRDVFDKFAAEAKVIAERSPAGSVFPLDAALQAVLAQRDGRRAVGEAVGGGALGTVDDVALNLLALFDVTSVSAALAIKRLGQREDSCPGVTGDLVDLWGRAEANRCLWFDSLTVFRGEEAEHRKAALHESARVLAPEAISIAFRLATPVTQYVEFVSKVLG